MFGNSFLTSKYLKRMQQGGATTVFAPDPSRYRSPIQPVNPAVLQYDINTKPLDTSGLIQVLQTKDAIDLKREQAVLEREKLKAEVDLAKNKLEAQKAKNTFDMMTNLFKTTGNASVNSKGQPMYNTTLAETPRFKPLYDNYNKGMDVLKEKMYKLASGPVDSKAQIELMKVSDEIKRYQSQIPTTTAETSDIKANENLFSIASGDPKHKDKRVDPYLFTTYLKNRETFLNEPPDVNSTGYELGVTPIKMAGLVYDAKAERDKLQDIYTSINKPIVSEQIVPGAKVISTVETKKAVDPKTASKAIADNIWADSGLRSYASSVYGLSLWDVTPTTEASVKELLRKRIEDVIVADDAMYNGTSGVISNIGTTSLPKSGGVSSSKVNTANTQQAAAAGAQTAAQQAVGGQGATTVTPPVAPPAGGTGAAGGGTKPVKKAPKVTTSDLSSKIDSYDRWGDVKKKAAEDLAKAQLESLGYIDYDGINSSFSGVEPSKINSFVTAEKAKLTTIKDASEYGATYNKDAGNFDISNSPGLKAAKDGSQVTLPDNAITFAAMKKMINWAGGFGKNINQNAGQKEAAKAGAVKANEIKLGNTGIVLKKKK